MHHNIYENNKNKLHFHGSGDPSNILLKHLFVSYIEYTFRSLLNKKALLPNNSENFRHY